VDASKRSRLASACTAALARRAAARTLDEDYVIQPQEEPRPAYSGSPGGADASVGDRARAFAESAFASFVRGRSDEQLDSLMGGGPGLRLLFKGMESSFAPEAARGFSGEILYALRSSRGDRSWTVSIDGARATAEQRDAVAPVVTLRADVPVFVRIAAGQLDPGKAALDGRLEIEGDFSVAARLGEMFGAAPRF
jgi:putative sterol carrier protein